jgi:hypothetical protein
MALVVNLAEIFTNSKVVRSSPTESTSPAKTDTHKTGPWHYVVAGTRV